MPNEALSDLDRAIQLDGKYVETYYYRGLCYKWLHEPDKARADFMLTIENTADKSLADKAGQESTQLR